MKSERAWSLALTALLAVTLVVNVLVDALDQSYQGLDTSLVLAAATAVSAAIIQRAARRQEREVQDAELERLRTTNQHLHRSLAAAAEELREASAQIRGLGGVNNWLTPARKSARLAARQREAGEGPDTDYALYGQPSAPSPEPEIFEVCRRRGCNHSPCRPQRLPERGAMVFPEPGPDFVPPPMHLDNFPATPDEVERLKTSLLCKHENVVPVDSAVTGQIVARWCPDCETQLEPGEEGW